MKKIILLNLPYPYGKSQIYMGGSLTSVGAQLIEAGCEVVYYDLNITAFDQIDFSDADAIGITVIGSPCIPGAIELANKLVQFKKPVVIGGQIVAKLGTREFAALFKNTHAVQIKNTFDLGQILSIPQEKLLDPFQLPLRKMWCAMQPETLRAYLSTEMALVFSQGCHFQCAFCAAEKKQKERFKSYLREDVEFLVTKAREFGLNRLEFYATSLDFFQNPQEVAEYLREIAEIQKESGAQIKIRCLACMSSFMKAREVIPNFKQLLNESGLWCVGFGVDGIDAIAWRNQKKVQNKSLEQVWACLDAAKECGITAETLLVMGFPEEGWNQFFKYLLFAMKAIRRYENVMLRPYLAKPQIPGNDYWGEDNPQRIFVQEPDRFLNLDFCAVGSVDTHPRRWHRYGANLAYLSICLFSFFGKCCTSPLIPVGKSRLWNQFARWWNRAVPFDR